MRITATEFQVQVFPEHKPGPFATIEMHTTAIDYATIYLDSEAEADQLIKAGCAAKDMLHAAKHATAMAAPPAQWLEEQPPAGDAPAPLASLRDRDHYTAPDVASAPPVCPIHGWQGCLCSGAPDYKVDPNLIAPEDRDVSSIAEIPVIAGAMAAKALAEAETDRIGGLHRDGHITELEAAEMIARITP